MAYVGLLCRVGEHTVNDPKFEELLGRSGKIVFPYIGFLIIFGFTVAFYVYFVFRELLETVADGPRIYFSSVFNIFQVFIIFLTFICYFYLDSYITNREYYESLQVLTVFFGWLGLTIQLAKFPTFGIYLHMAVCVFRQLVIFLIVFITILLAFSFSFYLALRKHSVFDNAFTSFLKTINMMVGEYNFDYNFTFESVRAVGGANGLVQILLMLFIFLVSITIANLIIALIIANIASLQKEADTYQLGRTVDQISTVHNVKQTLIRVLPCLRSVFHPTLHDYLGKKTVICVKMKEVRKEKENLLDTVESWFRSTGHQFAVYTYDQVYRKEGELTDFYLPERVVTKALENCRRKEVWGRLQGDCQDYSSSWREELFREEETLLED